MSYQLEPGRGPRPSSGDQARYHHAPPNGRAGFFPEKQGKTSRDVPVLPPPRPNQDKQARRKRHLISIEGHSVVLSIYLMLPLLCILVYVPIGVYTVCVPGEDGERSSAGVLEKCITECETSTASLLAEGLESLNRLRDKCVLDDSPKGSPSCKIDRESMKELDKLQTSVKILERKMKAVAGIVQDKDFSSAVDLVPDPLIEYKFLKYSVRNSSNDCKDYMKDCSTMLKAGDCEESPSIMLEACPQSCGFCTVKANKIVHNL